jgi:hypothetical protein
LVLLEEGGEESTPEMHEAKARPTDAGEYWKKWDPFRVAQRLFESEVARIDAECRNKNDKNEFGNRTKAIWTWFRELPGSKLEEAEKVAIKWNSEGAPDQKKMNM